MKFRYLFVLCFTFSIASLTAQDAFHRTYELVAGDSIQVSDATQSGGGAYYNVGAFFDSDTVRALQVNGFNSKGDLSWSRLIYSADSISFASTGSIAYVNNQLYVAATVNSPTENKVVYRLDNQGLLIGTKYYKKDDQDIAAGCEVSSFLGDDLLLSTSTVIDNETRGSLSRIDENGDVVWNRTYINADDIQNVVTDNVDNTFFQDSTISLVGQTLNGNSISSYISRLDTMGSEIWSKEYQFNSQLQHLFTLYKSIYASDSTTIAVGRIVEIDAIPLLNGIVTKVDSIGDQIWTKQISFPGLAFTTVFDAHVNEAGNVRVYGESVDLVLGTTTSFLLELDQNGEQLKLVTFGADVIVPGGASVSLLSTNDGGYAIFTPGNDGESIVPNFIKVDNTLNTPCSIEIQDLVTTDIKLQVRSIDWIADEAFDPVDSIAHMFNYNGFTNPTLMLTDTTYCPQDPIMKRFDAFQAEATGYAWSTGETTSEIIATEEGMFMVTVTMGEDVCYSLCDTVMIDRFPLPMISISQNSTNFCISKQVELSMIYNQGHTFSNENVKWSTGETGIAIGVSEIGTYGVTVTDDCGNSDEAEVVIGELPNLNGVVSISSQEIDSCADRQVQLNVGYQGQTAASFEWSTGENTSSIVVSEEGTYAVTVTNTCDVSDSTSIEVLPVTTTLRWPFVFFPNGQEEGNRTFGPVIDCPDLISNYEFHVYNRWGNEVFESTDVDAKWNGRYKDDPAPGAVYVYWARYNFNGAEQVDKGEVNLIR